MEQRISLITLGVRDIDKAAEFYHALGWQKVDTPDGVIAFDLLGQTLGLYPMAKLAEDIGLPVGDLGQGALTLGYNCHAKDEVAQTLDRAASAGAVILKPASDVFWGGTPRVFSRAGRKHMGDCVQPVFAIVARRRVSLEWVWLMRKPGSMWSLETLGRVRLSRHFYMRDFLYSEIGNFHAMQNIPENPDLAVETGRAFCETLMDPLEETFGRVAVRSGYRSPSLNQFGNDNRLNCARNTHPLECHIWDRGQGDERIAGASVVIPWFADQYDQGRDWRDLAWWMHDHLDYSDIWFFPKLCAFNLVWRPKPLRRIDSYIAPRGRLLITGQGPDEPPEKRRARYADFPPFRGINLPSAKQ